MRAFGRRVAAPGECRPDRWQARAGACAHPDLLLDDVALGPEARCDARESIEAGQKPDTLGAIQIGVARHRRGQGLSALMLAAMRRTAQEAGLTALIACVRPTAKTRYPLLPIETYAAWRRPGDGLPFDPWLRVHVRAGGRAVRASPRSMTIAGSIAEWEAWTGLSFPTSGPYVVEGALAPVEIDLAADRGVYHDPNIWVVHDLR